MRSERRYYNKKKIRSSQKRQCLGDMYPESWTHI